MLAWLVQQFQDAALGLALWFWVAAIWATVGAFMRDWRKAAAVTCGVLALVSGGLAVLWAAHLWETWQ